MSVVTNVIVHFGILEDYDEIAALQLKLADAKIAPLGYITGDTAGELWGGTKFPEVRLYAAAYNYLDEEAFLAAFRDVKWLDPDNLQVFVQRQNEDKITEVSVFDA